VLEVLKINSLLNVVNILISDKLMSKFSRYRKNQILLSQKKLITF